MFSTGDITIVDDGDNVLPPEGVDYVPDDTTTASEISVGESWINLNPFKGRIEHKYDEDWYRTELTQGDCYQIEIRGKSDAELGHPVADDLTPARPLPERRLPGRRRLPARYLERRRRREQQRPAHHPVQQDGNLLPGRHPRFIPRRGEIRRLPDQPGQGHQDLHRGRRRQPHLRTGSPRRTVSDGETATSPV